ncbi:MAG: pseudouridine synthase [Candidatus Omnitrophica bacterium]|nr:pseudouridine synthase [Candidatus Omnitrophota bacterium]
MDPIRLSLFISKSGYTSRRKADALIEEGKVEVNGTVVKEPFFRVNQDDKVKVCGKSLDTGRGKVYIVFNKPEGVTTTVEDKFAERKVVDFLPAKFKGIFPVGRLDKNSSGLLILTNDGDLCYRLTHPKFRVEKEYIVRVSGLVKADDCLRAKKGLVDEGEHLKVEAIRIIKSEEQTTVCNVIVCEGKKRHIRRLFRGLGFPVLELKRIRIGGLRLGDLKSGEYREVMKEVIEKNKPDSS